MTEQMSSPDSTPPAYESPSAAPGTNQRPPTTTTIDRVREIILGNDIQRPQRAEVERLRDMLFGAEIERYERRLIDLAVQSERLIGDLESVRERFGETDRTTARRFEAAETEIRATEQTLRREIDRQHSQDEVVRQLVSQESQHSLGVQGLAGQTAEHRRQILQLEQDLRAFKLQMADRFDHQERAAQALRREMRQMYDELRAEMRRYTERLDDQKTDRKALAGMLIEVAARLQTGTSVTSLLESLSPSDETK